MLVDAIWACEVSVALFFSFINVVSGVNELWLLWMIGGNGARRLNALRHLVGEVPVFIALIAFALLGIDAINTPYAGKSTKLFFAGVMLLFTIPPLFAARSLFFLTHRSIFKKQAKLIDTGGHRYPKHLLEKKPVEVIKILAIYPRHKNSQPLNFHADFQALNKGMPGCDLNILTGYDVTKKELLSESMRRKVDVFHIASHGLKEEGLLLSDGFIDASAIVSIIVACEAKIVVLSACETDQVAEAVLNSSNVECVIYTRVSVFDDHAIGFTEPFYRALSRGYTVKRAFSLGLTMLPVKEARNTWRFSGDSSFRLRSKKH